MDLRQLEYFVAVAEEANFTRAAERVHISQSGVSAQIRQLERELGAELFDRSARIATLTTAGEAALEHARSALAAAQAVGDAVGETNQMLRGRLAVGMVVGCSVTPFFDALAGFHKAHPGVEVTVREGGSDQLMNDVRRGSFDLGLVGCAQRPPDDLASLTIVSEGLVAVVPFDHPLAGRRNATLAQVAVHPIVCMPPGAGLRAVLDQALAAQGLRPAIAIQTTVAASIVDLAARGLGVGILSTSMAPSPLYHLQALPIRDVAVPAVLAVVWRHAASAAARELADHCGTAFGVALPASSHVSSG
jgi:DNA-binding transcriptional LysR family regulator